MRPPALCCILLLALLAPAGVVCAQQQERKLIDRVLQPDMTLANPMQARAYYGGSGSRVDTSKEARVRDFYFTQKFSARVYDTRDYRAKDYWRGDFKFDTKPASVKASDAAGKSYDTKALPVKDAREAGKGFNPSGKTYATREAEAKGKTSQNHLEEVNKGQPQMNIDQIRDLLNKPKLYPGAM